MKTLTQLTVALSLILTLSFTNAIAKELMPMPEETYIDDIPFDTEAIFDSIMNTELFQTYFMEEESYIDDIPFDTLLVAESSVIGIQSETYAMKEESYRKGSDFIR